MEIDKKLMNEVEILWTDHAEALSHFGLACVSAAKAGYKCKIRRYLRRGMVIATVAIVVITSYLDWVSEAY